MIKKRTICHFGAKCNECTRKFDCISATSVTSDLRKYLLKILGHRQKQTPQMTAGKEMHEMKQRGLKTITEYGIETFKRDYFKGKEITLKEVNVCSPSYGFKGIIDILSIQYRKDNKICVKIKELKSGWSKKHFIQIICYGLIFSDRNCMFYFERKGRKKIKLIPFKIYPNFFDLDIDIILEIGDKSVLYEFMKDNLIIDEKLRNYIIPVLNKANLRRNYHKNGVYYIGDTPPCEYCKQNSEYCSLWGICEKVVYNSKAKERQYYLGTKKTIKKSKPVVYNEIKIK